MAGIERVVIHSRVRQLCLSCPLTNMPDISLELRRPMDPSPRTRNHLLVCRAQQEEHQLWCIQTPRHQERSYSANNSRDDRPAATDSWSGWTAAPADTECQTRIGQRHQCCGEATSHWVEVSRMDRKMRGRQSYDGALRCPEWRRRHVWIGV